METYRGGTRDQRSACGTCGCVVVEGCPCSEDGEEELHDENN